MCVYTAYAKTFICQVTCVMQVATDNKRDIRQTPTVRISVSLRIHVVCSVGSLFTSESLNSQKVKILNSALVYIQSSYLQQE